MYTPEELAQLEAIADQLNVEENDQLDISPITTREDGGYTWTVNGTAYWTNRQGDGLFTSTYRETEDRQGNIWMDGDHNHQVTGTSQFSLAGISARTRRARVISYFTQGLLSYDRWLNYQGLAHSQANAVQFYNQQS